MNIKLLAEHLSTNGWFQSSYMKHKMTERRDRRTQSDERHEGFTPSNTTNTLINLLLLSSLDVWSRWRRGGDCYWQRRLHGRVLLSGQCDCQCTSTLELHKAVHEWNAASLLSCYAHLRFMAVLCVCFRSRTSGTALIRLMRMWLKSKSCTRSSCLLPHQIRVRDFTTTSFSSCSPDLTYSGSYWECFS